jgi:hypothetical protein
VFQGADIDSSLDFTSLALKYLDNAQLSQLAVKQVGNSL